MGIVWELDFYSRPILDDNQKKIWEVLICESPVDTRQSTDSLFRYAKYCSSTQVNSVWLRETLAEAMEKSAVKPQKIRFFRRQMNNMIVKACKELEIAPQASRRTYALHQWIQERMQEVYPTHPNYQPSNSPSVQYEPQTLQRLPDALIGEKWAFVSLEASAFAEMHEWETNFSEAFPLEMVGLTKETRIPGLIVFSSRAVAIAAWMSGLELAYIKYTPAPQAKLVLETGVNDSWILIKQLDSSTQREAAGFEVAKQKAKGVHFLAVQSSPQAEDFAGFWLLQELEAG